MDMPFRPLRGNVESAIMARIAMSAPMVAMVATMSEAQR
jgi:hypothetical protein